MKRGIKLTLILLGLVAGMLFPKEALSQNIECIIICPEKYRKEAPADPDRAADILKTFHASQSPPIYTEIVTTEWIYGEYGTGSGQEPPASPPPPADDWPASIQVPDEITAHFVTDQPNSVLDILGYIRDTGDSGHKYYEQFLQYVLILGNSLDVPPSYYVYNKIFTTPTHYDNWIPTDFFYSVINYDDLIPEYRVGRIPVKDQDDPLDTGEVSAITDSLLTTTNHTTVWDADEWIDHTLKMTTGGGGYYTIEANTAAAAAPAPGTLLVSGGKHQSSRNSTTITQTLLIDANLPVSQKWTPQEFKDEGYALRIIDDDTGATLGLYTIADNGVYNLICTEDDGWIQNDSGTITTVPSQQEIYVEGKTWGINDHSDNDRAVHILFGGGAGNSYDIVSNTADTLTILPDPTNLYDDGVAPDAQYEILTGTFIIPDGAASFDNYEIYKPGPFLATGVKVAVGNSYEIRDYRDDAIEMANKVSRWHTAADPAGTGFSDWFKKVTLAAGQPYDTWAYWGELYLVDLINKPDTGGDGKTYLSGMIVNKAFHTDFTVDEGFTEAEVREHLKDTDTGFLYLDGGGSGDGFHFDDGNEMTATEVRTYIAADDRTPVVLSSASDNAAFDIEIFDPGILYFPNDFSFGEAVVVSYDDNNTEGVANLGDDSFGGGIAYIGGSRVCYSVIWPRTSTDEGRLTLTGKRYMDDMLQDVFKEYHRYGDTLGTIFTEAIKDFLADNTVEGNKLNERTLYEFTLLGDPALYIPTPVTGTDRAMPILEARDPRSTVPSHNSMGMPVYEEDASSSPITVTIRITTDANTDKVEYKLIDPQPAPGVPDEIHGGQSGTIDTPGITPVDHDLTITYNAANPTRIFFLRVSAQDENLDYTREARLYFQVVRPFSLVPPPPDVLLVDDDQQDIYRFDSYPDTYPSYGTDHVSYYRLALENSALGYVENTDYVVWDVDNQYGEITWTALDYYNDESDRMVIWFTGDDIATLDHPYPTTIVGDADTADQKYLADYLDGGGRLFLTGQDIGYDIQGSDFFTNYLHAEWVDNPDTNIYYIDGVDGDPITDVFDDINIAGGTGAGNQTRPSEFNVVPPATGILYYDPTGGPGEVLLSPPGEAGLRVQTEVYKVVYLPFGFEAIDTASHTNRGRYQIMKAVVQWLDGSAPSIPPTVTSVSPLNGATDVPITTNISATFSESMDISTVTLTTFTTDPVTTGNFVWSTTTYTNDTVTFNPTSDLAHGTEYEVTITTGVKDTTGNGLDGDEDGTAEPSPTDDYIWKFTTTSLPQVSSASPTGTGVAVSADISAIFSKAMNTTATEDAFSYTDETTTWDKDDGMIAWSNEDKTMTFYPTNNLAYSTSYTVKITADATDNAGYNLDGNENGTADGTPADDYSRSFDTTSAPAGAGNGGGSTGCFIATSAYGSVGIGDTHRFTVSPVHPVNILRRFRDERLLTNPLGRAFVATYYKVSPPVADFIRNKEFLKAIVRFELKPLVRIAEKILK